MVIGKCSVKCFPGYLLINYKLNNVIGCETGKNTPLLFKKKA